MRDHGSGTGGHPRVARALIGWIPPDDAPNLLAGWAISAEMSPITRQRFETARQTAERRPRNEREKGIVSPASDRISDYLDQFWATDFALPFKRERWQVRSIDLRGVCAFQPSVMLDHALERTAVIGTDVEGLARVTLPLESDSIPPVQFDHIQQAWIIESDNPNLDLIGNFTRPIKGGNGFGFLVALCPSFMQVVRWRGRCFLKDGYHRAVGFLKQGVHQVPTLFLDLPDTPNPDFGPGVLPKQAWLGPHPPMLTDYLAEDVSMDVSLPRARRMIVIQALTLNPIS